MASTLVNNRTTVKNYGNSGNAYIFTQEVIQNATGDPATNKTSITVNLYIQGINGYSYNGFTTPKAAIYIQGTKMKEVVVGAVTTSKVKYCSIDYDLPHLDDGTQTLKVKTTYNPNTTGYSYLPASYTYESTTTMTVIPRKSTMSLTSTSITTLGSTTATITTRNENFTHTITTYYYGSYTLASDKTGASPTATITIPVGLRQTMARNGVSSATLTLSLNTYNGNTLLGTNDYSLSVSAPDPIVTVSPASVRCNSATTQWTLTDVDTYLLDYSVTRTCGSKSYSDLARTEGFISTRSSLANALFEQALPNNTTGTVTVSVTSYIKNTSTVVKTVTKTYEVTIPTGTYKPTISLVTNLVARQITTHGTRDGIAYLAGLDGASGVVSESIYGSSRIDTRSVTISYNGINSTETVGEFSISGSNVTIYAPGSTKAWPTSASNYTATVTYTVTDKRGTPASYSFTAVTVSGYFRPVIDASVERATSSGVADPEGTYINVAVSASTAVSTGGTLKTIEVKVENTTLIANNNDSNTLNARPATGTYLTNAEYSINVIATDNIDLSTTATVILPKIAVALSLHKNNGVGLGTVAIPQHVTVGLPLTAKDNVYVRGFMQVGTDSMSTTNSMEVKSGSGSLRLSASSDSTDLKRIWAFNASSSAKAIVTVDQSNNAIFYGSLSGNATTAETATKLGSSTVGGSSRPIYLNSGTATQVNIPTSGAWWQGVPSVGSDGVMEIGKYIDFHNTSAATTDNDGRIYTDGTNLISSKNFQAASFQSAQYTLTNRGLLLPRRFVFGKSTKSDITMTAGCWYAVTVSSSRTGYLSENPYLNVPTNTGTKLFSIDSAGGVKVNRAGIYKISASLYAHPGANGRIGAYILTSTSVLSSGWGASTAPSGSTETAKSVRFANDYDICVSIAPIVLSLASGASIYLAARAITSNGKAFCTNSGTYMLVEWVKDA